MKCRVCKTINDEDAYYCKNCGASLIAGLDDEDDDVRVIKEKEVKTKNRTKVKNKKEVKNNTKVIKEKEPSKGKTGIIVFLVIIILLLGGVAAYFGYDYYQKNYNIKVPNLVGMDYEDAEVAVAEADLKIKKVEQEDEDSNIDKVIKQSRRANSRVKKDTVITVTVGIKDTSFKVGKYIDMDINDVKELLDKDNIKYDIEYNEDLCDDDKVLKQDPMPGTKINSKYNTVALLVCREDKSVVVDKDKDDNEEKDSEDEEDE
ncbi:MAG: PASTA domain-containing protein [Bacilli bacterium]|nr:PASTA domain-containing protein [Bacilli bacterium]